MTDQEGCVNCLSYRSGRCHYHAPAPLSPVEVAVAKRRGLDLVGVEPVWPKVEPDDWCRQWEAK